MQASSGPYIPILYSIEDLTVDDLSSLLKVDAQLTTDGKDLVLYGGPKFPKFRPVEPKQLLEYGIKALNNLKRARKEENIEIVYHAVMKVTGEKENKEFDKKYQAIKAALDNIKKGNDAQNFKAKLNESFELIFGDKRITIKELSDNPSLASIGQISISQKKDEESVSKQPQPSPKSKISPPVPPRPPPRPLKIDVTQANASTKSQETPTPSTSRVTSPKRSSPPLPPRPKPQAETPTPTPKSPKSKAETETPTPKSPEPGRESIKSPGKFPPKPTSPRPPK